MKKLRFWALIALPVLAISCKKEEATPSPAVKFMTLTTGSTWNYKLVSNPSTTPTTNNYTLTATDRDTSIGGKTYKVFSNSGGVSEYYNITGGDYYTYRKLPDELGGGFAEVLYLKDNIAEGATWSQTTTMTISGFTTNLTLNNTLQHKGVTKVVNGTTYTDVTEVVTTITAAIPLPHTLTSDIHYYYAPKFGQIQNDTQISLDVPSISFSTDFEQQTTLVTANIL